MMKNQKSNLIKYLTEQGFKPEVLNAFRKVSREKFVPKEYRDMTYDDGALPIGKGQTISQPSTIAFMLQLLNVKDNQKILEVGSGSGYVLELLSEINPNGKIIGVERIKELVNSSREILQYSKNIEIIHGSGFNGLKEKSPFDRILVSAAAQEIPKELVLQLNVDGILVIPVRDSIVVVEKDKKKEKRREYEGFCFVPLIDS